MSNVPSATPTAATALNREAIVALLARETGMATEALEDMVEAIGQGESEEDYFGATPNAMGRLHNAALGYYRGKRYQQAQGLFEALLYLTRGQKAYVWRSLAACYQVQHYYELAARCYAKSTALDPEDHFSAVYHGECLCLLGRRQEGLAALQQVVDRTHRTLGMQPHVLRAKALIAAGGGPGRPSPLARQGMAELAVQQSVGRGKHAPEAPPLEQVAQSQQWSAEALERLAEVDADLAVARRGPIPDEGIRNQLADEETRSRLEQIAQAVADKALTIRELADFSEEQMDAAYAVACLHLERGELLQAMQVTSMMMWIDSRDTRFYRLAGLCAHRLRLFCLADYYYALVDIWRPGGADPATLIYRGEAKMLSDELDSGMDLVRQGIKSSSGDHSMAELVRRGEALLRHGAAMQHQRAGKGQ